MRLVIAAPANGALLKDALKAHLQNDPRVGSLVDLSSLDGTYPQLSFAAGRGGAGLPRGVGGGAGGKKIFFASPPFRYWMESRYLYLNIATRISLIFIFAPSDWLYC